MIKALRGSVRMGRGRLACQQLAASNFCCLVSHLSSGIKTLSPHSNCLNLSDSVKPLDILMPQSYQYFFSIFRKCLVVYNKDTAEVNISRREFGNIATKTGVDDEKAT